MNREEANKLVGQYYMAVRGLAGEDGLDIEQQVHDRLVSALTAAPEKPGVKVLTKDEFTKALATYWESSAVSQAHRMAYESLVQNNERLREIVKCLWPNIKHLDVSGDLVHEVTNIIKGG